MGLEFGVRMRIPRASLSGFRFGFIGRRIQMKSNIVLYLHLELIGFRAFGGLRYARGFLTSPACTIV